MSGIFDPGPEDSLTSGTVSFGSKTNATLNQSTMDDMLSRRKDLPDDLACFLQQQKQRQARLETTMRSFPSTGSTGDIDHDKFDQKKKKNPHEDPLSHRIIEKRRRDRMNNCLADLSRLIPSSYLKKGRGRIEKTEIIEMAIKHIRHLQSHPCTKKEGCEIKQEIESGLSKASSVESFRVGYHECLTETMHFLVEKEGLYAGNSFCVRLMTHLQKHFDKLGRASTSEIISHVGRSRQGNNPDVVEPSVIRERLHDREDLGVKSEYGVSSEESGYKTDETKTVVSLDEPSRAIQSTVPGHFSGAEADVETIEKDGNPSDLSLHPSIRGSNEKIPEDLSMSSGLYKFKSNIRNRFHSMQEDEKDLLISAKRTRQDSASTDVDQSFEVDLDSRLPISDTFASYNSPLRHKSGNTDDIKLSPSPGPNPSSLSGQHIPVFALNSRGSYYVPLSVDSSNLEDFLPYLTEPGCGPYHPITISVKFSSILPVSSTHSSMPLTPDTEFSNVNSRNTGAGRGGVGVIQAQQSVIKNWRDPT